MNQEQLTVTQLQELLRGRYGSAMQEEEFQAELRARRRNANEDLPTLRADISHLMFFGIFGRCVDAGPENGYRLFSKFKI